MGLPLHIYAKKVAPIHLHLHFKLEFFFPHRSKVSQGPGNLVKGGLPLHIYAKWGAPIHLHLHFKLEFFFFRTAPKFRKASKSG
jgi:hypothetical protein